LRHKARSWHHQSGINHHRSRAAIIHVNPHRLAL
jgi:hypothetical protein